jgi:hypothetical protein
MLEVENALNKKSLTLKQDMFLKQNTSTEYYSRNFQVSYDYFANVRRHHPSPPYEKIGHMELESTCTVKQQLEPEILLQHSCIMLCQYLIL